MASNSPSKRRHRIEPITVDELLNAAGMSGYVSFLNVKPEEYGRTGAAPASTVVVEPTSTVVIEPASTVDLGPASIDDAESASTVVAEPLDTVVAGLPSTVDAGPESTVAVEPAATVVAGPTSTVDLGPASTDDAESASTVYWTAEGIGGLFPASRLRKIKLAQDALTHAEESVYDALWGVKDQSRDRERRTSMGYDAIAKAARVSKRNAAAIVQRLIQKGFLEISAPPLTFGARQATVYRVFGYAAVREDQRRRNRTWTIRTGNGIGYAKPLAMRLDPASTVDAGSTTTVDAGLSSTVDAAQSSTVDAAPPVISIGKNTRQTTSSPVLAEAAARWGLDDDALRRIRNGARACAPDATEEEVAYWIDRKAAPLSRRKETTNLTGLLITAVPKAFEGQAFLQWREKHRAELLEAAAAGQRRAREQEAEAARAEASARAWAALGEEERARRRAAELPRIKRDYPRMTPAQWNGLAETTARQVFQGELEQGSGA